MHASVTRSDKVFIKIYRLVRWLFGLGFISVGIYFFEEGGWPAIIFGLLFIATTFFRPARCMDSSCTFPINPSAQTKD